MCAINGKYRMKFSLEVFSAPTEPMTMAEFEEHVRRQIAETEMRLNNSGRIRVHITEVEETLAVKRSRKAVAIHFPDKSRCGTAVCGTKSKGERKWLSEDASGQARDVTCKRCLHLVANKTLHPAKNQMVTVRLIHNGPNRIAVIREIRECAGIGLKEAKELSDVPMYKNQSVNIGEFPHERAKRIVEAIVQAGGAASFE